MAQRQIPDLPLASTPLENTDDFHLRQGATDKRVPLEEVTSFVFEDSDYKTESQQIDSNYSIPSPDTVNRILNVDTSGGDVTITFQSAVAADLKKKIVVYHVVNGNLCSIAGLFDEDYILQDGEIIIASVQETETSTYNWILESLDSRTKQLLEQLDILTDLPQPDGSLLFEFSSTNLANSNGELPISFSGIYFVDAGDSDAKFSNRGVLCSNSINVYLEYSYSLGNAGYMKFRIKPKFNYDTSDNHYIISTESGGTLDDALIFAYDQSIDQFFLKVQDDSTNYISIASEVFTSNPQLQQWHDIVITWDKNNNDDLDGKGNAKYFMNGTSRPVTKVGNGIANFSTSKTILTLMNINRTGLLYTLPTPACFTDFLLGDTWNTDDSNHDGGSVQPYFNYNRVAYKDHNSLIDNYGNMGCKSLSAEYINNGSGYTRTIKIPIGTWNMDSTASVTIAHGLTNRELENIQGIFVQIYSDLGITNLTAPLNGYDEATTARAHGGVRWLASGNIILDRVNGGHFDQTGIYSSTSINRGYIYITVGI